MRRHLSRRTNETIWTKQYGRMEQKYGRYCVHCVITLFWVVRLVFRMCNLPGYEVTLYCVFFSCTCEICTTRNCLFMKLINLVIFTQDQKSDPLNVLSIILQTRRILLFSKQYSAATLNHINNGPIFHVWSRPGFGLN